MSILSSFIALEELDQQIAEEISTPVPDVEQVEAEAQEFEEVSTGIDEDTEALTDSVQALESIIDLVASSPTPMSQPIDQFAARAVRLALESNDIIASNGGGALATTADKGSTKKDFLDKAKDFAKKIWEALASMAGKVLQWLRDTWAKVTDRLLKNANKAKELAAKLGSINSKPGAVIAEEKVLAAVANRDGDDVGNVVIAVFEHARSQSEKATVASLKQMTLLIEAIASGKSNNQTLLGSVVTAMRDAGGGWESEGKPADLKGVTVPEGSEVYLSAPFFGGNQAWLTVPKDDANIKDWNHGLGKLSEVKPIDKKAPDVNELQKICEYIGTGQDLIRLYQLAVKPLDELSKGLKAAVAKEKGEGDKELVKQLQTVIPRMIKGPQVAAYNYAATASSIALAYVQEGVKAHTAPDAEAAAAKAE